MGVNLFLSGVTRIPVTGPEPFNTLVCVNAQTTGGPKDLTKGRLGRWSVSVPTLFRLAGFDQRVPPAFEHSTTAWLSEIGPAEDDRWVVAVDSASRAGFGPADGGYFVIVDLAAMPGAPAPGTCFVVAEQVAVCVVGMVVQITSFVLCFEPPPSQGGKGRGFSGTANTQISQSARSITELAASRLGVPIYSSPDVTTRFRC